MPDGISARKLAILMSFSGAGGVEKMMTNLIQEFAVRPGLEIELILIRCSGPYLDLIPAGVKVHKLKTGHSFTAIPELAKHFRHSRPDALLVAKDRAGRAAVRARAWAGMDFPITLRLGTNLSASLEHRSSISRWLRLAALPGVYRSIEHVVGNSQGVADDIKKLAALSDRQVSVIRNPVVTSRMLGLARQPTPHSWLEDSVPVVIGMGRMTVQKDFSTLIKAFALARQKEIMRLIILGDGAERESLQNLVNELGLAENVLMPGHQDNPYAWLSRADLFVLSSRWEGSPNALTEAFALGVPCVSTDCPSGPAEILAGGRYGKLVEVGNLDQLAEAIIDSLHGEGAVEDREPILREYRAQVSADNYLQTIFASS